MIHTLRALTVAATLLVIAITAGAQGVATPPPPASPVASEPEKEAKPVEAPASEVATEDSEAMSFHTYYYLDPQPDKLPKMVRELAAEIGADAKGNGPILSAFYAPIFTANPKRIAPWFEELGDMPRTYRRILWRAAALANIPEATEALRAASKTADEEDARFIETFLTNKAPDLLTVTPQFTRMLDMLWSSFSSSGDERYVKKIINALALDDSKDPNEIIIAGAAKWSLQSNAWQHSKVLAICRDQLPTASEAVAKRLREVIAAAEKDLAEEPCPEPKKP